MILNNIDYNNRLICQTLFSQSLIFRRFAILLLNSEKNIIHKMIFLEKPIFRQILDKK